MGQSVDVVSVLLGRWWAGDGERHASCLATTMADGDTATAALAVYELARRPTTTEIVLANRSGGPEAIIDAYESRHLPPVGPTGAPA